MDQGEIDYNVKIEKLKNYPTEDLETKISERTAFITNAMRAGLIDPATVQKMKNSGYGESIACWKKVGECTDGLKTFSKAQMAECEKGKDALCEPTYVCDEESTEPPGAHHY